MSNEQTTVAQIQQNMMNLRMQEVKEVTDSFFDALVVNAPKAKMPEQIFKEHFLPFFAGQGTVTKDNPVIAEWISVAGTAMAEVDVINPQGETLFTVPPLMDTNILEIAKRRIGGSIQDIYQQFDLKNNHLPVVANNFLNNALSGKVQELASNQKANTANAERWSNILTRYGYQNTETQTASSTESTNTDDDVIYE